LRNNKETKQEKVLKNMGSPNKAINRNKENIIQNMAEFKETRR